MMFATPCRDTLCPCYTCHLVRTISQRSNSKRCAFLRSQLRNRNRRWPGMFAVEIYAAVRRFVFVEGKSRREAARVFGLSRDTISKMCRYSAPPGYVRSKAPERPKLGPLVPVIDAQK